MTVVRYEPWALLNRLHRELDQTFETRPATRPGRRRSISTRKPGASWCTRICRA